MDLKKYETPKEVLGKKKRVYIAYHHNDKKYTRQIIYDILTNYECECYIDENHADDLEIDERKLYINQADIIVLMVSNRFLTEVNVGRNVDLKFAKEKQKMLLPILLEDDLEEKFNNIIGSYHFLKRTTSKYYNQLKDYFEKNFNNVVQDKKVYKGKIFISYRKKDRVKLTKILDFISKVDYLDALEVWYDDFLIPGENYNKIIDKNIRECDFVLFLITENCLEKYNYIKMIEYPNALRYGKKVIPVALEEYKNPEIYKIYNNLDEVINLVENPEAFEERIKEIPQLSNIFNENLSVEEIGELGLEYLRKNQNIKGLKFITDAANQHYGPAMQKLGLLYLDGTMIEKNFEKAIYWLDKNLNILVNEFDNKYDLQDLKDIHSYGLSAGKLALFLHNLITSEEINDNKYLPIYKHITKQLQKVGVLSDLVNPGHFLIDESRSLLNEDQPIEALNKLNEASYYISSTYKMTKNPALKLTYINILLQQEDIYRYIGDNFNDYNAYVQASDSLVKALDLIMYFNKYFELYHTTTLDILTNLSAVAYTIEKKYNDIDLARKLYEKIFYTSKEFYRLCPSVDISFRIAMVSVAYAAAGLDTPILEVLEEGLEYINKSLNAGKYPDYMILYEGIQKRIKMWPHNLG